MARKNQPDRRLDFDELAAAEAFLSVVKANGFTAAAQGARQEHVEPVAHGRRARAAARRAAARAHDAPPAPDRGRLALRGARRGAARGAARGSRRDRRAHRRRSARPPARDDAGLGRRAPARSRACPSCAAGYPELRARARSLRSQRAARAGRLRPRDPCRPARRLVAARAAAGQGAGAARGVHRATSRSTASRSSRRTSRATRASSSVRSRARTSGRFTAAVRARAGIEVDGVVHTTSPALAAQLAVDGVGLVRIVEWIDPRRAAAR